VQASAKSGSGLHFYECLPFGQQTLRVQPHAGKRPYQRVLPPRFRQVLRLTFPNPAAARDTLQ